MISLDDQATLLDGTPWAKGLSWPQIRLMIDYMKLRAFSAGESLIREGDRDATLFVLAEGEVEVRKRDGNGEEKTIARLREGGGFGEMSLLDGEPRSASVRGIRDGVVLSLSGEDLDRLANDRPRLAAEIFRRLGKVASQHLRQTSGQLVDLPGV